MKQCMGCMEIYQDNLKSCPYCGYIEGTMTENTLHIEPGAILNNRYIIGKVLGYGGFGVTYIAWDSLLEQKVAIKEFLPSEFATRMLGRMEITVFSGDKEKQFMEGLVKFVEEAKKLAKFNNVPGIIKIFDCIEENNTAYIIMELLEGETLATMLEREKKISADRAISMLLPVMESLRQVNAQGIIHRDIAPDNIFITSKNEIKLIDFGAARYATTSLSRSLTIIIKPGYSPEEQYRSMGDQGSWTDVYSIGATLYRMITGVVPCDSMERRAYLEQKGEDLLKPLTKYTNKISKNQEIAILNAMNIKVHERTLDMNRLIEELTSVTDIQRLENKKKRAISFNMPMWVKVLSIIIVCLVAAVVIIFDKKSNSVTMETGVARMPNIVNSSIDEAIDELKEKKLSYEIIGYTYLSTDTQNKVIYQSEVPGAKINTNVPIKIKVSKSKKTYEVANVIAMEKNKAKKLLEADGYNVKIGESKYNAVIPKDCVIKQESDETEGNKSVILTVSKGNKNNIANKYIESSEVVGVHFIDVIKQAKEKNLKVQVIERISSSEVEEGIVIKATTGNNAQLSTRLQTGTVIKLVVSSGNNEVTIGDYIGKDIDEIRNLLIPRGIVVEEECQLVEGVKHGEIFGQEPEKGTSIRTGDIVKLKVGIGTEEFKMIDVVGKTQEEAERLLNRYGLRIKIKQGYKKGAKKGYVIGQSIEKDTDAKVNDEIEITICDPSTEVVLPEMVGKDIEILEKELVDLGIECEKQLEFSELIKKGIVISASQAAGYKCKVGTKIRIVVSAGPGDIAEVSNVVNVDVNSAKSTLEKQGLVVETKYEFSDTISEDIVISQSIVAGSRASTGDKVILTVSKGKKATLTLSNVEPISAGSSKGIYVTYTPSYAKIEWVISDKTIATITPATETIPKGTSTIWEAKITGLKAGTVNVTAVITYCDDTKQSVSKRIVIK